MAARSGVLKRGVWAPSTAVAGDVALYVIDAFVIEEQRALFTQVLSGLWLDKAQVFFVNQHCF